MKTETNRFSLLGSNSFTAFFLSESSEAFNNSIFKNTLISLMIYSISSTYINDINLLILLISGIFILPYFLFSALAGALADKHDKSELIKFVKIFEFFVMIISFVGFYLNSLTLLIGCLFFMGAKAAFFNPIKYGITPELLENKKIVAGNGFLFAGNFTGIFIGVLVALGTSMSLPGWLYTFSLVCLVSGIIGIYASFKLPKLKSFNPDLIISSNLLTETLNLLKDMKGHRNVIRPSIGISWFWLTSFTFISQMQNFINDIITPNFSILIFLSSLFLVGIVTGCLLCNRITKGLIDATYVPLAALGMAVFTLDLCWAASLVNNSHNIYEIKDLLSSFLGIRLCIDLFLTAFMSGIYIIPLYSILQTRAAENFRYKAIAVNNLINSCFMVISVIGTYFMFLLGFSVIHVFILLGISNLLFGIYVCNLLPTELINSLTRFFFNLLFNVEVKNIENVKKAGSKVVIVSNHTSFIDAALIATYIPGRLIFAIESYISQLWFVKPFLSFARTYVIDPSKPLSLKGLIDRVRAGRKIVIFPEGRISTTGGLMKVSEWPGLIADKADAKILPIRIDGAQYSIFSYLKGKIRRKILPKITITVLESRSFHVPEKVKGRDRREIASAKFHDLMTNMLYESSNFDRSLFDALIDAAHVNGKGHKILSDTNRKPISYGTLITKSMVVGSALSSITKKGEYVGVMMPNAIATVVIFYGLQAIGRIPAMINFSSGRANIINSCKVAKVKKILTSRQFIERAELEKEVSALEKDGKIEIIYLEDFAKTISVFTKVKGFLMSLSPKLSHHLMNKGATSEDDAVVLFTSGSEGVPKGVVLSHKNLIANQNQVISLFDLSSQDVFFSALPLFHSFGLNAGLLLPISWGCKIILYPSPLHYRIVPEFAYETNATVILGTDTFLSGYANYAHPYDFYNIRLVIAGAEKIKDSTRQKWMEKFGLRILEGYGTTEASPIVTINTLMRNKSGSIGRFIPGMEYKLEKVEGIDVGGKLLIKGSNLMKGYLKPEKPGVIQPFGEWYDTGDIVNVDEDGFVFILGRAKRFAKIGGEMVSLSAVEQYLNALWPDNNHAAISIADEKKGEIIIVYTDRKSAKKEQIVEYTKSKGISELAIPKKVKYISEVPVMGNGKTNYVELKRLAEEDKEE